MSELITRTFPATLFEEGYARAGKEHRAYYLIYRERTDEIGLTPEPNADDEVLSSYEDEGLIP